MSSAHSLWRALRFANQTRLPFRLNSFAIEWLHCQRYPHIANDQQFRYDAATRKRIETLTLATSC